MFRIITSLLLLFLYNNSIAQQKHIFSLSPASFLFDGKPFEIISGEMHPARIPKEYWKHRIQMAKAMGCNTIAVYVFWNYHETKEGQFDFSTGNHNIAAFIRLCQQEGMWVLLRPGPYVCAEWDFGGLPPYLLKIPDIRLRCMDPRYMAAVNRYITRSGKEIAPLQCTHGGPILMVQIENEFGSYGNDKLYLQALKTAWLRNGINVPFYTADGPTPYMLEAGHIAGAAVGLDSGGNEKDFEQARKSDPKVPAFSSETYPGWLTHWGEKWARPDTMELKKEIEFLLNTNRSFNLYVVHGGTNFGFNAGANSFFPTQFQPDITSYDYDAPINEQGLPTAKYYMLRRLIQQHLKYTLPPVPAPVKTITIGEIEMKKSGNLWNYKLPEIHTVQPLTMEAMGQNQGLVLYSTKLIGLKKGKLKIWEPHDYALVFLNGTFIDTVYRDGGHWEVDLPATKVDTPRLDILVEAMGHINFAQFMIDRKGITDRVTLNGMTLMNWQITKFPMDEKFIQMHPPVKSNTTTPANTCNFFKGNFELKETGDTYFDLSGYFKGILFINGHNLGRYWNIGPQQRLYCPAAWLKKGSNEILVFDLLQVNASSIKTFAHLTD